MFKITLNTHPTYGEIGQPNPMRWRIMYRNKNTLESQSNLIKCKDFFNDVVAYKQADKQFKMYNFDNKVKFNRFGLYMHLTEIGKVDLFLSNLAVLNERLEQDLDTRVKAFKQGKKQVVIHIPNKLWKNTWYISLVTMLIRCCNYDKAYEKWDDFFAADAPMNTAENAFTPAAKTNAQKIGFKLPAKYTKFWWWSGDVYNSSNKDAFNPSSIHNNGVSAWSNFLKLEG